MGLKNINMVIRRMKVKFETKIIFFNKQHESLISSNLTDDLHKCLFTCLKSNETIFTTVLYRHR